MKTRKRQSMKPVKTRFVILFISTIEVLLRITRKKFTLMKPKIKLMNFYRLVWGLEIKAEVKCQRNQEKIWDPINGPTKTKEEWVKPGEGQSMKPMKSLSKSVLVDTNRLEPAGKSICSQHTAHEKGYLPCNSAATQTLTHNLTRRRCSGLPTMLSMSRH